MSSVKKRALLYHLDLGIGGAERLVVCLALALADANWDVTIATTRFDPSRCFPECRDKRLRIIQSGGSIPRDFLSVFTALFSAIRLIWLYCYLLILSKKDETKYDLIINDQLAMFNPLLKRLGRRVAFYCHFPDPLMASRNRFFSRSYRFVMDSLEASGMKSTDLIWVNSEFTRSKFETVFDKKSHDRVEVLYPCVPSDMDKGFDLPEGLLKDRFFLSLNRFEFKKNHKLAIEAFIKFQTSSSDKEKEYKLVICGGYDPTLPENEACYQALKEAANDHVLFIRSASDGVRSALLRDATATVYTPSNEHFGIVPIESMSYGTPVIAVNSGGPTESILDGVTGSLNEPTADCFCESMEKWATSVSKEKVKEACQLRAKDFSFEMFSSRLMRRLEE